MNKNTHGWAGWICVSSVVLTATNSNSTIVGSKICHGLSNMYKNYGIHQIEMHVEETPTKTQTKS